MSRFSFTQGLDFKKPRPPFLWLAKVAIAIAFWIAVMIAFVLSIGGSVSGQMTLQEHVEDCQKFAESIGEGKMVFTTPEVFDRATVILSDAEQEPFYVQQIPANIRKLCGEGTWSDGTPIKIAVLDTGIDRVHHERGEFQRIKDSNLHNTTSEARTNPRGYAVNFHGSHVAGAIGADRNDSQIVGICPQAEIISVQCLGGRSGSGAVSWIAGSIDWSVAQGADIINMSLGGGFSETIERSIKAAHDAGVILVASIGNSGVRGGGHPGTSKYTIASAAIDRDFNLATFSSRSNSPPMFADLGVMTVAPGLNGSLQRSSGTSMSAPVLTGKLALAMGWFDREKGKRPSGNDEIVEYVLPHTRDLGSRGFDVGFGHGWIEIKNVVEKNPITNPDPDPVPPQFTPWVIDQQDELNIKLKREKK